MANSKITELPVTTLVDSTDVLPIVDISDGETKKVTVQQITDFVTSSIVSVSTPIGPDKSIQFNDGGSFSGSSVLVFDKNTNELIGENIIATSVLKLNHSLGPVFSVDSPAADSIRLNADGSTNFLTIQSSPILTASLFTGPQTTFFGGVGSKMQILSNNLSINKPATNFANATLDVNGNTIISGNLTVTGSSSSLGVNNEPGSGARIGAAKLGNVSGPSPNQFAVFGHHQVVDFNPLAAAVLQKSSTSTRFGGLNEIEFGFISPQEVLKIKNFGDEGRPRIIVSGAAGEEVADLIIGAEQSEGYKTFIVGPDASNINLVTYTNLTNERPTLTLSRRRNPGSPLNSDNLGEINWIPGTLSGDEGTGAGIRAKATQDWIFGVAQGSELQFYVTENATNIQTTRLHISNNGNVGIGTENPNFKLSVTGTLGVSGATTLSTVSGTTAQFTTISGSTISASNYVGIVSPIVPSTVCLTDVVLDTVTAFPITASITQPGTYLVNLLCNFSQSDTGGCVITNTNSGGLVLANTFYTYTQPNTVTVATPSVNSPSFFANNFSGLSAIFIDGFIQVTTSGILSFSVLKLSNPTVSILKAGSGLMVTKVN
jgi:hypothetical protein